MALSAPQQAGDVLDGRYRLVARLGHGGFGDVWRAEELLPDGAPFREVALKLLLASGADAVDWAEEAKLLASFRHPSLCTIYAAGILALEPPVRFVAMELLEGQNLAELLRARGPVAWRRVLGWAARAAAALDQIHAAGVVHLDLKPANLFLGGDGALKVLDFGIARRAGVATVIARRGQRLSAALSPREAEAATGLFIAGPAARVASSHSDEAFAATRPVDSSGPRVVIGTPGFMAPEVLELAEPTAAADAYALAVCVVQLVTGHLPHAAPDEPVTWDDPTAVSAWLDAIRTATLRGALRPIEEGAMGLPRGLAALLRRLLAVDPAARAVAPGKLGALFDEAWERPHGVPDPPYFGAAPFPPEGEGLLFGRDDDIARLGRELEFEPAVVLQGPVGVGKSSLARAGLVPYLARRGADGKDDWIAVPLVGVGAGVVDVDAALPEGLRGADIEAIAAHAERSPVGLVLLVDPLDAAGAAPGSRLATLCDAIAAGPLRPGLRLCAVVGEDAAAALSGTPLGASLRAALRFVGLPATAAVKDIVAGPAHFAGVPVFGVDAVAADVQRELRGGGLPYVGLALSDWWRGRAPSLQGERWTASGGVRGAVVRHAEKVLAALDTGDRAIAEEILLRLSSTDGRPIPWDEDELESAVAAEPAEARRVLARLARDHLVDVSGAAVRIGHEALLVEWSTLASARLAQMERLSFLERLREARVAWERADNHPDFLLHGALLDESRTHAGWAQRGLTAAGRAFLAASRRRARTRTAVRWALAVVAALVLGGGVWGETLLEDAREAEARATAAAAEQEQLADLVQRARRTDDPYQRVAFAAAALERGSTDGLLPLEIAAAAGNVAHAQFLTLDHVDAPVFPWDDRFLLGLGSATTLAFTDFRASSDVEATDDPDVEPDPFAVEPALSRIRPHAAPLVERVPFAFDTAFATRAADGEVKVFRLRDDGLPALAAVAPMRCAGAVHVAAAAPVLACAVDRGVARWDLRVPAASAAREQAFPGTVADVSADGDRVVAFAGKRVLFWAPGEGSATERRVSQPPSLARLSPRDRVAAVLVGMTVEIVDEQSPEEPMFSFETHQQGTDLLRWDEGGLDLAVCAQGRGRWHYLKRGGRARGDAPPRGDPCVVPRPKGQPDPVHTTADYPELAERDLGVHSPLGGFRLRRHRYVTRDLVLFDAGGSVAPAAAARLLRFQGRDQIGGEEVVGEKDSIVAVERDDALAMFQVGSEIRFYATADGSRLFARKGNFLRRCGDGRYLAYAVEGATYRVFDARVGGTVAMVAREPGLVVGADSGCGVLYTQRLDGMLVAHPLSGEPAREMGAADGYVFDTRPSAGRGGAGAGAGLYLMVSSGAIARIDEPASTVRVLGYATPRATAVADGPRPGDVVFADATGVVLLRPGEAPVWLRDGTGGAEWEDLSVAPDGGSMLLAAEDRLAALDLGRREILGSIPAAGRGRLSRWDEEGSVLAWSFQRPGGADGMVIPRGVTLARGVAAAISNLTVEKGRMALRR